MNDEKLTPLMLIAVVAGTGILLAVFLLPWPRTLDWSSQPPGHISASQVFANIIGPLSAIAAFGALIFNIQTANRTLRQSTNAERAVRFQKAGELLADDSEATNIGAVTMLRDIAFEDPKHYGPTVIQMLIVFVLESDGGMEPANPYYRGISRKRFKPKWPPSRFPTAEAIGVLAAIHELEWTDDPHWLRDGRLQVTYAYLTDQEFAGVSFDNFDFHRLVAADVTFDDCSLRNLCITGVVGGEDGLTFHNCDLADADLTLENDFEDESRSKTKPVPVSFVECRNLDSAKVNGMPATEWIKHRRSYSALA